MYKFDLDDWSPAPPTTEVEHEDLRALSVDWALAGRCGSDRDGHEWLVLYNHAAQYYTHGEDDLVAMHLVRDRATKTYTIDGCTFPTLACAEGWLVTQGASPDALERQSAFLGSAAETSRAIEDRVRREFPRYHRSYSWSDQMVHASHVVLKDTAATDPERAFLGHVEYRTEDGYAVREAGFATRDAARQWLADFEPGGDDPATEDMASTRVTAAARSHSQAGTEASPAPQPAPTRNPATTSSPDTKRPR